MDVQVEGSVSAIETAFHVTMGVYQHPTENRTFYAPDREPTAGSALRAVAHFGLGQLLDPASHVRQEERLRAGPRRRSRDTRLARHHRLRPVGFFLGQRHARRLLRRNALTGAGQNLGLLEYAGTDLADLTTYFTNVGQTNNVPITLLSTDGTSTSCVYSAEAAATATTPSRHST